MAEASIEIDLALKIDEALKSVDGIGKSIKEMQRSFDQSAKEVKKFGKSANDSLDSIKTGFKALGVAAAAALASLATGKVADFFGSAIGEAQKLEDSVHTLNVSLAQAGDYSEETSKNFQAFADNLSNATNIGGDLILTQTAMAKSMGLTNEQTELAIKAATELSATFGISFEDAVTKVTQAYAGNGAQLGKLVPQLRGLTDEQLKAGDATKYLLDRFSGAAEAKTQTFSGSITRLGEVFDNFKESIGLVITQNPVLVAGINQVSEIFKTFGDSVSENKDDLTQFVTLLVQGVAEAAPIVVAAVSAMATSVQKMIDGFQLARASVKNLAAGVAGFFGDQEAANQLLKEQDEIFQGIIDREKGFDALQNVLTDVGVATAKFSQNIEKAGKASTKSTGPLNLYTNAAKVNTDQLLANAKAAEDAKKAQEKYIDDLKASTKTLVESFENVGKTTDEILVDTFNKNVRTIKAALDNGIVSLEQYKETYEKMRKGLANDQAEAFKKQGMGDQDQAVEQQQKRGFFDGILEVYETIKGYVIEGFEIGSAIFTSLFSGDFIRQLSYQVSSIFGTAQNNFQALETLSNNIFGKDAVTRVNEKTGETEVVEERVKGLLETLPEFVNKMIEQAPAMIEKIIGGLDLLVDKLLDAMPRVAEVLASGLTKFFTAFIKKLPQIIASLPSIIDPFIKAIPEMVRVLARNIKPIIAEFLKALGEVFASIVEIMPEVIQELLYAMPAIVEGFATGIVEAMPRILAALVNLLAEEIKTGNLSKALIVGTTLAIRNAFIAQFDIARTIGQMMGQGISEWGKSVGGKVGEGFRDFIAGAVEIFQNAGTYIWNGFRSLFSADAWTGLGNVIYNNIYNGFVAIYDALKSILNIGGGGGGSGGYIGQTWDRWGFASGGLVPAGFPNDSFPAMLQSGERVLNEDQTAIFSRLVQATERLEGRGGSGQIVNIQLTIGQKQLADVLLDLNKSGFRTA